MVGEEPLVKLCGVAFCPSFGDVGFDAGSPALENPSSAHLRLASFHRALMNRVPVITSLSDLRR